MTLTELAEAVNVDLADVRVVLGWMGDAIPESDIPKNVATATHRYLSPNQERTVPELYLPGVDPDWRE